MHLQVACLVESWDNKGKQFHSRKKSSALSQNNQCSIAPIQEP